MQQTENLAPHVQEIARALQNRMEPNAIEDELRRYLEYGVPLAQAKRDIVRMHGGTLTAGAKKLNGLQAEDRGVEVTGKVLTVNPKDITVKGQPKTIWYGFIADETGKVPYTAWKDFELQRGVVYQVKNAYAKKGFRDPVDLQLGDYTEMNATDLEMDVKDDYQANASGPTPSGEFGGRISTERKVRDLRDGMQGVTITGRVLTLEKREVTTVNGMKTLVSGEIADETGRVPYSAWEPENLPAEFVENAVVRVKSAYVRSFRGVPNVNLNQYTTIEVVSDSALPDAASLRESKPITLAELDAAGGGQGIRVEGVVLEVKKGSGLIFRCGADACNRVLQKMECRVHGKQKGMPDLRIKAVIDDGLGAATFFAGREVTEHVLGKTLAQAQEEAREAMTVDVIQDELTTKLTTQRVVMEGSASSDEFGLTLNADTLTFARVENVEAQAEKLLGQVVEVLQEVGQ